MKRLKFTESHIVFEIKRVDTGTRLSKSSELTKSLQTSLRLQGRSQGRLILIPPALLP